MSTIAVALTIGLVLGPFIGGVLSDQNIFSWFNIYVPFYLAIFLALFNLIILFIWVKKDPLSLNKVVKFSLLFKELLWILQNKSLMRHLTTFVCFELAWSLFYQSVPLIINNISHGSPSFIGIFLAYIGFCLSINLMFINRIFIQIFTINRMIVIGMIILFSALLLTMFSFQTLYLWILIIPITTGVAICYASLVSEISNQLSKTKQGFIMGIVNSLLALSFAITGALVGIIFYMKQVLPMIISASLIGLGCLLLTWHTISFKKPKARLMIEQ